MKQQPHPDTDNPPIWEELPVAIRAFVDFGAKEKRSFEKPIDIGPWPFTLVFDCETLTDPSQRLRFGAYMWFQGDYLAEQGFFYEPDTLTLGELQTLRRYAEHRKYEVITRDEFVDEILLDMAYVLGARIVGFHLTFDLSRLAQSHKRAKGKMHGGFSYIISVSRWAPRLRTKHVTRRLSFIDFSATYRGRKTRPMQKRKQKPSPPRRGYFVDLKTLGGALFAGNYKLDSLVKTLGIEEGKLKTEEHGKTLTNDYLTYAMRDVQVTAECFNRLKNRFDQLGLDHITLETAFSEAAIGKAHFQQMGIKPWLEKQPDFPKELTGIALSTFYGGRSEVHCRRRACRIIYCDFLSMYPSVFVLMDLFKWVIAEGVDWHDATAETRDFLGTLTIDKLMEPRTWPDLTALVRVKLDDDIVPVRAAYDDSVTGEADDYTIGLNRAKSDVPLWYTLADCAASTILNGRPPEVIETIRFSPKRLQDDLRPMNILKNPSYHINPQADIFFKRAIEFRHETKTQRDIATEPLKSRLDAEQNFLKILSNATGYGIFAQFIAELLSKKQQVMCFGASGKGCQISTNKEERPGEFFHPLLATFITGAARLMLAIAERTARDIGLDWAFCDTDSMAFMKPEHMSENHFRDSVQFVVDQFVKLNPYDFEGSLLKVEDENYVDAPEGRKLAALYALPVSAKRYALFNIDDQNQPIIRKASTHGVGQYVSPYQLEDAPASIPSPKYKLKDVDRWEHDLWYVIVRAALAGDIDSVDLSVLPGLNKPAASQYAATSPDRLAWFDAHNKKSSPEKHVGPSNFLLTFQARPRADLVPVRMILKQDKPRRGRKRKPKVIRPVAPYHHDPAIAAKQAFDRETDKPVKVSELLTYADVLRDYHRHPETKFLNAGAYENGSTERRCIHIRAENIHYIGKESNEWEAEAFGVLDETPVADWGVDRHFLDSAEARMNEAVARHELQAIAEVCGLTRQTIATALRNWANASSNTRRRVQFAIRTLNQNLELDADAILTAANQLLIDGTITLRELATRIGCDPSNLSKILSGKRRPPKIILRAIADALANQG